MPFQQAIESSNAHTNTPIEADMVRPAPMNESLNRGRSCCLTCKTEFCKKKCKYKVKHLACEICDDTCLDYKKV